MRLQRLLFSLTMALALGLASPAMAADVSVPSYFFSPAELKIAVGERVIWNFDDDVRHSTKALPGQADSWNSGLKAADEIYERTFAVPGRFNYICEPHSFMKGVIEVGEDAETDTLAHFKRVRRGDDVKISFKLNEAAKVTYKLTKGPSRRKVKRGRLDAGRHSFRMNNLRPGEYKGKLILVDDFDNKATSQNSFVIR
jgi:plastocyanin